MFSSGSQYGRRNGAQLRSTTGCLPCKAGKVKCGEEKPCCRRCVRLGRECKYGSDSNNDNDNNSDSQNSSPNFEEENLVKLEKPTVGLKLLPLFGRDQDERRAFEFYFRYAAPAMSNVVDMAFWRGIVLQLCQTEPAIWDALITISSLYENPQYRISAYTPSNISDRSTVDDNHRRTLRWYARSLSNVREQLQEGKADIHISLITCILYICIETMQGHTEDGLKLFQQGIKLVTQLTSHDNSNRRDRRALTFLEDVTLPVYERLSMVSTIIIGTTSPLSTSIIPNSPSSSDSHNNHLSTMSEAYMSLHKVVAQCVEFHDRATEVVRRGGAEVDKQIEYFHMEQSHLQSRLDDWQRAFEVLDEIQALSKSTEYKGLAALLRMCWSCASIITAITLCQDETAYDQYMDLFAEMVKDGETCLTYTAVADGSQPEFTFEMGVGLPLFFVATKCRSPRIRREAIRLLQRAPPVQGLYKLARAIFIVRQVVEWEEGRPFSLDCDEEDASWLPDQNQRMGMLLAVSDHLPTAELRFLRNRWDSGACRWQLVEESVSLGATENITM